MTETTEQTTFAKEPVQIRKSMYVVITVETVDGGGQRIVPHTILPSACYFDEYIQQAGLDKDKARMLKAPLGSLLVPINEMYKMRGFEDELPDAQTILTTMIEGMGALCAYFNGTNRNQDVMSIIGGLVVTLGGLIMQLPEDAPVIGDPITALFYNAAKYGWQPAAEEFSETLFPNKEA